MTTNFPKINIARFPAYAGAYILKVVENGSLYVGSTKNLNKRLRSHLYMLKNNRHYSKGLQDAFNDGKKFEITLYITETRKEAYDIEQSKILEMRPGGTLLNVRDNVNVGMPIRKYRRMLRDKSDGYKTPGQRLSETKAKKSRKISIEGVEYPSILVASAKLGLSYGKIDNRLRLNNGKFKDWFFLD